MNAGLTCRRLPARHAALLVAAMGILLLGAAGRGSGDRIMLLPRVHNGANLRYLTQARLERGVKTKSNVATMFSPRDLRRDLSLGLRLSVQEIRNVSGRPMLAAETVVLADGESSNRNATAKHPTVNFTVGGEGEVTRADGLDDLDAEQRLAWQFWIAQFAFGWTLPRAGVKPGEKWKSEEVEKAPAPIANLVWERETTYVQNDKCPIVPEEQCASFLTVSTLRQKSNPKDATPEDYRLHELKTSGTVNGTNQTVIYISLKTGLLMRATEDVQQSMEVTIAKADGSNQVHYDVNVISHFETVFVSPSISPAR
jgi:hypothetical protein